MAGTDRGTVWLWIQLQCGFSLSVQPSMLWHCWLGVRRRPVKNCMLGCWYGYLFGVRCRLFVRGPADATASQNPIICCWYGGWWLWWLWCVCLCRSGAHKKSTHWAQSVMSTIALSSHICFQPLSVSVSLCVCISVVHDTAEVLRFSDNLALCRVFGLFRLQKSR